MMINMVDVDTRWGYRSFELLKRDGKPDLPPSEPRRTNIDLARNWNNRRAFVKLLKRAETQEPD